MPPEVSSNTVRIGRRMVVAPLMLDGAIIGDVFRAYVEQFLAPITARRPEQRGENATSDSDPVDGATWRPADGEVPKLLCGRCRGDGHIVQQSAGGDVRLASDLLLRSRGRCHRGPPGHKRVAAAFRRVATTDDPQHHDAERKSWVLAPSGSMTKGGGTIPLP